MGIVQPLDKFGTMRCRRCRNKKPATTEFFKPTRNVKSGVSATCRICSARYHRRWKLKNKARIAPLRRARYAALHADVRRAKHEAFVLSKPIRVRAGRLRSGILNRSRDKNLPIDAAVFTIGYFMDLISRTPNCPCCGKEIDYGYKFLNAGPKPNSPSIDRFDPIKGYVVGNLSLICWRCNNLKRDATADELETIARWMRAHDNPPLASFR